MPDWYKIEALEAVQELKSDAAQGLSSAEAARRFSEYGPNELKVAARTSAWSLFLSQFKNVLIIILLIAVEIVLYIIG